MKAIVYEKYGSPDMLKLKEIERPIPKDGEVLVKVQAVSINSSDWEFLTGTPKYTRFWGLFKPRIKILGSDIAGIIEAVGKGVTKFQEGDGVFGDIMDYWGGFAEYVSIPAKVLTLKPASLTFEEAAAIPQAALVALQGLRDKGRLKSGQHVLINGGGGGAGSFAIQLAKMYGAKVTAVDSALKLNMMISLGADNVIDYKKEDFTKNNVKYDLILDFVASHSIFDYKRVLNKNGKYVMVGGSISHIFQTLILGSLISILGKRKMTILGAKPNKDIEYILELFESRKIRPIIEKKFSLNEVPEALQHLGEGKALGKLVVII